MLMISYILGTMPRVGRCGRLARIETQKAITSQREAFEGESSHPEAVVNMKE